MSEVDSVAEPHHCSRNDYPAVEITVIEDPDEPIIGIFPFGGVYRVGFGLDRASFARCAVLWMPQCRDQERAHKTENRADQAENRCDASPPVIPRRGVVSGASEHHRTRDCAG